MAVSGAAKYTLAHLSEALQRQMALQRAQEGELARRDRQRAITTRRADRTAELRATILDSAVALLAVIQTDPAGVAADDGHADRQALWDALIGIQQTCMDADSYETLTQHRCHLETVQARWQSRLAKTEAARKANRLREAQAQSRIDAQFAYDMLAATLLEIPADIRRTVDPENSRMLDERMTQAQQALEVGDHPLALGRVAEAEVLWQAHQAAVTRSRQRLEAIRDRTVGTLFDLQVQIDSLLQEDVVATWCGEELRQFDSLLRKAHDAANREDWPSASRATTQVAEALEPMLAKAQTRQLAEDARSHLVNSLVHVLQMQDFAVSAPDLSDARNLDSAVVFRAVRPDRRSLGLSIPVRGRLTYEVDGYITRMESGAAGQAMATCDEAEARIQAIHQALAAEFGISTDGVTWEGQDPTRIQKGARDIPDGGAHGPRSTGGS